MLKEAGQGVLRNETGCCCTGEQQPECVPVCESVGFEQIQSACVDAKVITPQGESWRSESIFVMKTWSNQEKPQPADKEARV